MMSSAQDTRYKLLRMSQTVQLQYYTYDSVNKSRLYISVLHFLPSVAV